MQSWLIVELAFILNQILLAIFLIKEPSDDFYLMFWLQYIKPRAVQTKSQPLDCNIIFLSEKKVEFLHTLSLGVEIVDSWEDRSKKIRKLPLGISNDMFPDAT